MPIYEYRCLDCGAQFEKMQKVSDQPPEICDKCGGNLEKQWSLSGFQFKGEGWYVTDYAGKKKENKEKTEKTETAAGSGGEKQEKSSSPESTVKGDSASNPKSDASDGSKSEGSKKETAPKKD